MLKGSDVCTLMDRALWKRFGETALRTPHAIQGLSDNGPQHTATESVFYAQLGEPTRTEPIARWILEDSDPGGVCLRGFAHLAKGC